MEEPTPGQQAIKKLATNLEWALRMVEASAAPFAVSADRLADEVREAVKLRQSERGKQTMAESMKHVEKKRYYDVEITLGAIRS